jgi:hypothetical protein
MRSLIVIMALVGITPASTSALLLWSARILEGPTLDEVKTNHSAWVEPVNELPEYKMQGCVLESIALANLSAFPATTANIDASIERRVGG